MGFFREVVLPPAPLPSLAPRPPQENGTVKKAIAQMTQSLLLALAARSQLQELREKLRSPAVDKGPILKAKPPTTQKDILGVCCDPMVLAQQLTHIELVSVQGACSGRGGLHALPPPRAPGPPHLPSHLHCRAPLAGQAAVPGEACFPARPLALAGVCPPKQRFLCVWSPAAQQPCVNGTGWVVRTKVAPGWKTSLGGGDRLRG